MFVALTSVLSSFHVVITGIVLPSQDVASQANIDGVRGAGRRLSHLTSTRNRGRSSELGDGIKSFS